MASLLLASVGSAEAQTAATAPFEADTLEARLGGSVVDTVRYPLTRRGDTVDHVHGIRVADPYRWLEADDSPEVQAWIQAQNATTERFLASLPERASIRRLVHALLDVPRLYVPLLAGGRYFQLRAEPGLGQPLLFVRDSLGGAERLLLDVNTLEPRGTVELLTHGLAPSPDGRLLAYGTIEGGRYAQTLRILRVDTGELLPDAVHGMRAWHWATWAPDGSGFFYTRQVGADRPGLPAEQLVFHRIGTTVDHDVVVFEQGGLMPRAWITGDGRYLHVLGAQGNEPVNLLWAGDLHAAGTDPGAVRLTAVVDSADALYQVVGSLGHTLYVATTNDAPRGRIVAIDARWPARDAWRTVVAESEQALPIDAFNPRMRIVDGRLVLRVSDGVREVLRVHPLDGGAPRDVPLPEHGSVREFRGDADDAELLYGFGRFPHLSVVNRYDMRTHATTQIASAPSRFDAERYETQRVTYTSRDGTEIPMYITHRRGIQRDGSHAVYLTGYGGFGGSMGSSGDDALRTAAWLELGGIVAVPSLRGGSEFGGDWHRDGMRERKQNVFDDFIAAAEYLVEAGYTTPARIAISGQSNGGLLVAAVMVQRPELFAVAVPDVGLTDMMRFHLLPGGGAGITEYGVADAADRARYLYAYSPLHNVREDVCAPATLITTGINDEAVHPSHSYKFTAALQHAAVAAARDCPPVLLRAEADAGHGGGASAAARVDKAVDVLAFMLWGTRAGQLLPAADRQPHDRRLELRARGLILLPAVERDVP
jgi:prolyl oligopeptidase